jgi:hypothetical protein
MAPPGSGQWRPAALGSIFLAGPARTLPCWASKKESEAHDGTSDALARATHAAGRVRGVGRRFDLIYLSFPRGYE